MKYLALACSMFWLAACPNARGPITRPTPPQKPTLSVAITKFTLDNGLKVILHRDTSDPIVAIATVVHVGSNREKPGKTGFAHFFEHMAFNDSENVPRGANRKMIPELGGRRNGGTWSDGTIYYEVVPKDAFEKLLWIDSDRLGFMINTVTEGALEREKQVVKNEKRQRYDNRAYGHTRRVIAEALYPQGHPYSWLTIGDLEDLQNATLADVRAFYDRYYVPSNATLVIAGDIDIATTKSLVTQWFGEIPAGNHRVTKPTPRPTTLSQTKKRYHLDKFAQLPELRLVFPTVEAYHPDAYPLDMLARILAHGKRAPLFTEIVKTRKLAPTVSAGHRANELAGTLSLRIRAHDGVDLDDALTAVEKALKDFDIKSFADNDLKRVKAKQEVRFFRQYESILDKAEQLAVYNEYAGDPQFGVQELAALRRVTKADVMRVFRKYVRNRPAVITSFVPHDRPELIVDGSRKANIVEEKIVANADKRPAQPTPKSIRKTPTRHSRTEPPLGPASQPRPPQVWTAKTKSQSIPIVGIRNAEIPVVEFSLRISGGQWLDAADKLGTASLLAQLLNEGTKNRTPAELEDAIGLLGASIYVVATRDSLLFRGTTLSHNFEPTLKLVTEMLLEPRWDRDEFERVHARQRAQIKQATAAPVSVARRVLTQELYGRSHVAGQPMGGTAETVARIELADLQAWYRDKLSPHNASFHIVGDIGRTRVRNALENLAANWRGPKVALPPSVRPQAARSKLIFVDIPDAKQSVILAGRLTEPGGAPDYYKLRTANDRLGGGISARLTQVLRIQKGYTYGASSTATRPAYTGMWVASTQVRSNVTRASLEVFRKILRDYRATYSERELTATKNLLRKGSALRYETLSQRLGMLETMSRLRLPADYVSRELEAIEGLSLADTRKTIDDYIDPDELVYVVVGDAKTQRAQLTNLGLGTPILVDRQGVPVAP